MENFSFRETIFTVTVQTSKHFCSTLLSPLVTSNVPKIAAEPHFASLASYHNEYNAYLQALSLLPLALPFTAPTHHFRRYTGINKQIAKQMHSRNVCLLRRCYVCPHVPKQIPKVFGKAT